MNTNKSFKVSLCSVPVEGAGTKLDRDRSEGSLGIVPKVAIVSLVVWMERNGYKRENWDFLDIDMLFPDDAELRRYFTELKPSVVGLSAVVSTSYSQVKRIAAIIRGVSPHAWIVMGGNLAASSEAVLFNTEVDVTIVGDGEIAWVDFLNYVVKNGRMKDYDQLKMIKGISYVDDRDGSLYFAEYGKSIKAQEMVLPDYEVLKSGLKSDQDAIWNYFRPALASGWFNLDPRAYALDRGKNIAGIFASKGCVAKCTFCQRSTKGYRVQPHEDLGEHLKYLKSNFNVGFIQILDENFGSDKKHSRDFAKILWEHDMLWMATGVRCTSISEEDIIFYKEHGCSALKFGVESGSQKILDLMEKVFTISDVYKAINLCIKHGIYSPLAVMVGMPGEDEHSAAATGKMIGQIAATLGVHPKEMGYDIFYALPLPGTPLYEYGEYVGVIDRTPAGTGEYLERVTNAGTYKRYYVNLNGAHESEVIFWDILVGMESSREFRRLKKVTKVLNGDMQNKYTEMYQLKKKNNPRYSLKYSALDFTFITKFIDTHIVGSQFIDFLPRTLIYPFIKYLNWFEFLIQKRYQKNLSNNLFAMSGMGVKRVDFKDLESIKSSKQKSLRGIVNKIEVREEKIYHIELHHKSRSLLSKGL